MSGPQSFSGAEHGVATAAQPLAGLRVIDCTTGIAGAFCTKLLGDFGADVVLVEPPGGSALRLRPPRPRVDADSDHGGLFGWLATNKASYISEVNTSQGGLATLMRATDILVIDREFDLGEGWVDRFRSLNSALIVAELSPFGADGPYAHFKSSRLVKLALTGWMHLVGLKGREPLATRGDQLSECFPGAYACLAILACLLRRAATGSGELISVCEAEALMCTNRYFETVLSYTGDQRERQGTASGSAYGIFATRDGQVALGIAGHLHQWERLCEVTERADLLEFERLGAFRDNPQAHEIITNWFAAQTTQGAFQQLQLQGLLPAGPVINGEDVAQVPQHIDRGYIQNVEDSRLGTLALPGPPVLLTGGSWRLRKAAPSLGEGGPQMIAGWEIAARRFMPAVPRPSAAAGSTSVAGSPNSSASLSSPLPLEGVRVVEVVDWWAGPFCGMLLADLGADVIKVESPTRLEVWRTTSANAASPKPWETGPLFNAVNRNKRHIAIDLRNPEGVAALKSVLTNVDVIVENFTPGIVEGFGFHYPTLLDQAPQLCFASVSGFGQTGPWRSYRANAIVAEATGLVSAVTGYADTGRVAHGVGPGDTAAGTMAAIGIVLSLLLRLETGEGCRVDVSQMEALTSLMGHSVVAASLGESPWRPAGNFDDLCAPANAYPCAGEDQWIAITAAGEDEWHRLCVVMGRADWLNDATLSQLTGRRERAIEIQAGIADWTREHEKTNLMYMLQAAGVPAGAVLSPSELLGNEHYAARNFYQFVDRAYVGTHPYYPPVVRLESSPLGIRFPAPIFGTNTVEVLRELGGLSDNRVTDLLRSAACATEFLGKPQLDPTRR